MVFAGVYPIDPTDYENLRASLEKLQLNDASLTFTPETSVALGFGFRCGFLGLLHMEIVQERLDREFDMDVITTVPNVTYMCYDKQGGVKEVHNPSGLYRSYHDALSRQTRRTHRPAVCQWQSRGAALHVTFGRNSD